LRFQELSLNNLWGIHLHVAGLAEMMFNILNKCACAPHRQNLCFKRLDMTDEIPNAATADEGPTNEERAAWAEVGLLAFAQRTGMARENVGDDEDSFLIVADLLADLGHWCDRKGVGMKSALEYAAGHYQTETGGKGKQLTKMNTSEEREGD
jgi:hypothetical protein